jgi:hypothetical protein
MNGWKWLSCAEWPPGTLCNADGSDLSTDTHMTEEQALSISKALRRTGFGGEGKVFPVRTWIEER